MQELAALAVFFDNDLLDFINLVIIGGCLLLFVYRILFLFLISVVVWCIFACVLLPPFVSVLFIWPWLVCPASSCPSFLFHRALVILSLYTMQCDVSHGLPGFLEGFICPVFVTFV